MHSLILGFWSKLSMENSEAATHTRFKKKVFGKNATNLLESTPAKV